MTNPDEVLHPSGIPVLIALREDETRDYIPFTQLDDLSLDLGHSSAIMTLVSESPGVCIAGPTHIFKTPIASKMGWSSSYNRFPFNPR